MIDLFGRAWLISRSPDMPAAGISNFPFVVTDLCFAITAAVLVDATNFAMSSLAGGRDAAGACAATAVALAMTSGTIAAALRASEKKDSAEPCMKAPET